jgi:antirestriction protein ArdC
MIDLVMTILTCAIAYQIGQYMGFRQAEKLINNIRKGN